MFQRDQQQKKPEQSATFFVILMFVCFLFWEWLRPLPVLTDTYVIPQFLLLFVCILLLKYLRVHMFMRSVLIGAMFLFVLHNIFFVTPLFSMEWVAYLRTELVHSISVIINREWHLLSSIVRTIFFLLLVVYSALYLYNAGKDQQRMLFFFLMTVFYIAVLDTFTIYDGQWAIMRTFVAGFILLSFVHMMKVSRLSVQGATGMTRHFLPEENKFPASWLIASLVLLLLVTSLSYAAPKSEPNWPDPFAFMERSISDVMSTGLGLPSVKRSGYGGSDSTLGGSFVQDDGIVFYAETDELHYWRGESRDLYTGAGWENTESEHVFFHAGQVANVWAAENQLFSDELEFDAVRSSVQFENPRFAQVFTSGDVLYLDVRPAPEELAIYPSSGVVVTRESSNASSAYIDEYDLISSYPRFSENDLIQANMDDVPGELQERYTQLPETLPDRVIQLAIDETQGMSLAYEKVKHIESYFLNEDYVYQTSDVPVPNQDEDFVDQFLFETQFGYCDHYSSAMVVMLRAIDIPARWVKGFTAGSVQTAGDPSLPDGMIEDIPVDEEESTYQTIVRNRNAHSWVEVYFPGVGWVPFEPTRTFQSPYSFDREDDPDAADETESPDVDFEDRFNDEDVDLDTDLDEDVDRDSDENAGASSGSGGNDSNIGLWLAVSVIMIVLALLVYSVLYRRKLWLGWVIYRYKQGNDSRWILSSYALLIRLLGQFIKKKKASQTMREYVRSLEPHFQTSELYTLTKQFEDFRYGSKLSHAHDASQIQRLWLSIVNKLR